MEANGIKSTSWLLQDPTYFDKDIRYTLTSDAADLLSKVAERTTIKTQFDLMEEAFSCLLANLYHGYALDAPLVYSRSSNAYSIKSKRYGYDFYTSRRMIRLIDAMYEMGLTRGVKGRIDSSGRHYPSKMWAIGDLTEMFSTAPHPVFIKRNQEVLYLKDENKVPINYVDDPQTKRYRRQISEFNEMLSSLSIEFKVSYASLSDIPEERVGKVGKLVSLAETGGIWLDTWEGIPLHTYYRNRECRKGGGIDSGASSGAGNGKREPCTESAHKQYDLKYYNIVDHDAFLCNLFNKIELNGDVKTETNFMRRIFNVDWFHGGRFYDAPHVTIPSACRNTMLINGEPTVEPDYSGQHIRMLYNLLGIDYRDECYVYQKADKANGVERNRIKLASLILINASHRGRALRAIRRKCEKKGIGYPIDQIARYSELANNFETYHSPIKEYLLSGMGLELQFKDSTIMAGILERMTKRGIPALPVHDSVICPAQHEGFLRQVMVEEYQKVMGFEPVL